MDITNTILVVIDPTQKQQHALGQAMVLARKLDMDLELLICDYDSNLIEHKKFINSNDLSTHIDGFMEKHHQYLDELAIPLREQGITVNCKTSWDYPLDEGIIRQAMRSMPFLIVKDTHYHHLLTRSILKNTDWNLIRTCPVPLLFVKPSTLWKTPVVTCAVNPIHDTYAPNEFDKNILQLGKLVSNKMQGTLLVYHTYYSILNLPITTYSWGGQFGGIFTEEADQQIRQSHKQALYKLADESSIDHNQITMEEGEAKYSLPDFISRTNTDLLVIGASTKNRFEQVFIGGTTESVLDEVSCDILVIHSPDFKSPVNKEYQSAHE